MGNCGVGFAPVKPQMREWLIQLMEGVEDIPQRSAVGRHQVAVETFPEYMDALERMPRALDIGCQVPHGVAALRDGAKRRGATMRHRKKSKMRRITREALLAGALGFSTSRALIHKGADGKYVPAPLPDSTKCLALAGHWATRASRRVPDDLEPRRYGSGNGLDAQLAAETGQPVAFNVQQIDTHPELWRTCSARLRTPARRRATVRRVLRSARWLCCSRGVGPSPRSSPSRPYQPLQVVGGRTLPGAAGSGSSRQTAVRTAVRLDEFPEDEGAGLSQDVRLGLRPDEPDQPVARRRWRPARATAEEVAYDWMLEDEGRRSSTSRCSTTPRKLSHTQQLLQHPHHALAGDGGAHCGYICDASLPTFMLTHWTRGIARGDKLPLELIVAAADQQHGGHRPQRPRIDQTRLHRRSQSD